MKANRGGKKPDSSLFSTYSHIEDLQDSFLSSALEARRVRPSIPFELTNFLAELATFATFAVSPANPSESADSDGSVHRKRAGTASDSRTDMEVEYGLSRGY